MKKIAKLNKQITRKLNIDETILKIKKKICHVMSKSLNTLIYLNLTI